MATEQLSLDFTAIAQAEEQTYPIAYLEKASKTYSADILSEKNRIRGIFQHLGSPHVCTGTSFLHGLAEVRLCQLFSPEEWQFRHHPIPDEPNYYWGRKFEYRGQTWIMGDRITLKPHSKERAIAIALSKIQWGESMAERTIPYLTGERNDPFYGKDYYQSQFQKAVETLQEGIQECEKLGIAISSDRQIAHTALLTHITQL